MRTLRTLVAVAALAGRCPAVPATALAAASQRVRASALLAGVPFPLAAVELRIHKAQRRLELWSSGRLVKRYAVGLGHRGLGPKRREGDHLTPEGRFYLCTRNERSQFHLFLGLSYPNEAAAARGLQDGTLTKAQHGAILRTLQAGTCPPWNTPLGGAVGIHGGGSSADWTWGCIALENPEIEELWVACPIGSPILIEAQ
jgi:murein L,D-transpeptidase YafK